MSKILIAYGTSEGQTAKIAQQLAGFIRAQGHDAFTGDIARGAPAPAGYQAVIVGASVHKGKHQRWVVDYVRRNRPALERLPSAFFSVSLAIQDGSEKGEVRNAPHDCLLARFPPRAGEAATQKIDRRQVAANFSILLVAHY